MGTPIEDPTYGVDCEHCTPNVWAADHTPRDLYLFFQGISKTGAAPPAAEPPNGIYTVRQTPGSPCLWIFDDVTIFSYGTTADVAVFASWLPIPGFWFSGSTGKCGPRASNELVAGPPDVWGVGGEAARWSWAPGWAPWTCCDTYNFAPVEDTFYDEFMTPDLDPESVFFRLANVPQNINVLVKFDNSEF